MAILNIPVVSQNNGTLIDGKYRFTVRFYTTGGMLISDARFPQNQLVESDASLPSTIAFNVTGSGYTINNVVARLFPWTGYIAEKNLTGIEIDCDVPECIAPSYSSHSLTPPNCIEGVTDNIGQLVVTGLQNYNKYKLFVGTPTSNGYLTAVSSVSASISIPINYPTSAGTTQYTLRLYNGDDECNADMTFSATYTPCQSEVITDVLFPQITYIGITRDNISRDTSLYFTSSSSLMWRISAVSGTQPVGKTINNLDWNNSTWNPVETEWAVAPITHIARANPVSSGVGGLVGGVTYYIDLKLTSAPNNVFRMSYTVPNNNINPRIEITPIPSVPCNKTGFLVYDWRGGYSSHVTAEDAACNDSGSGGTGAFSTGIVVGSEAYINTTNGNCEMLPDGYYYFKSGISVHGNTARIQSGVITELDPTSCGGSSTFITTLGTKETIVNDRQYNIITSHNTSVTVTSGNLVKLTAPATKMSFNGINTCYMHIVNGMHAEVPLAERNALLGAGLDLPEGNYVYYFIYANTSGGGPNYNEMFNGSWTLFSKDNVEGNGQTSQNNRSAMMEAIVISVVKNVEIPNNVVKPPRDLRMLSWLPVFQGFQYDINNFPTHQSFGTTKVFTIGKQSSDKMTAINKDVDLGIRLQYIYSELDSVGAKYKWRNVQGIVGGGVTTNASAIANTFYGGRDLMAMAEVAENVGNTFGCPPCWGVTKQVAVEWNNKAVQQGASGPEDHEYYGDYFQALYGEDNAAQYRSEANGRMLMANQTNARLMNVLPLETDNYGQSEYFTGGAYNVRNWITGGYLDAPIFNGKAKWIYKLIFGLERKFMAAPNRKTMTFSSSTYEGVHMDTIRAGSNLRLHFPIEDGDLMRRSKLGIAWDTMYTQALYTFIFGGSYIIWDSSGFANLDPYGFGWGMWNVNVDEHGNPIPSSIRWQPTGSSTTVQYDSNNSAHPTRDVGNSGEFPSDVMHGENGAYSAALVYKHLKMDNDYMSITTEYANFSYTVNGGSVINGYNGTNTPITGSNGAKINKYNSPNYGQSNIVTADWYNKPIAIYMEGTSGKAALFHNPHAASTDVHSVTFNNGGGKTFTVIGNKPHIEKY